MLRFASFLLVLTLTTLSAQAGWQDIPSKAFRLGPPPAAGSEKERSDYAKLHQLQEQRTDEQCQLDASHAIPTPKALFGGSRGVLKPAELASVGPLLSRVLRFSQRVSLHYKNKYQRPRPYELDETIEPCVKKPGGSKAYPSSHAVMGFVGACVLSQLYEDRAREIVSHGKLIGALRVVVGVHHPSDVEAGWYLGAQICKALLRDTVFQEELELYR